MREWLAAQVDARAPLGAFCLASAPRLPEAAADVLAATRALAADAPPGPPPPAWARGEPLRYAADVWAAAALADADAPRAAHWLAHLAIGLDAPARDMAAALAHGALELCARVAALDARAAAAPPDAAAEAALARFAAAAARTHALSLNAWHIRALQMLAVPRGAGVAHRALAARRNLFFEYQIELPPAPEKLLMCVVGAGGAAVGDPFAACAGAAGWQRVLAATLPAAHAALTLVSDDRRFSRLAVRLLGDGAWPADAPARPTLVLLGARSYVLHGPRVDAHAGPGAALAAWRRALRADLGVAVADVLSAFFD